MISGRSSFAPPCGRERAAFELSSAARHRGCLYRADATFRERCFFFKEGMTSLDRRAVDGSVVAKPATLISSAAFAIVGRPGDVTDVRPIKLVRNGSAYGLVDEGRTIWWRGEERFESEVRSALAFRLAGKRYLLVRWPEDICKFWYNVFSIGAALTPVAGNAYGCDP
jgi:hypothetical protein